MSTDDPDDYPSAMTKLLRQLDGVHTVYATKSPVPTIVTAVVELVKSKPVGVHLVTIDEDDDHIDIDACIGVTKDESALNVCRRAHDALEQFLADEGDLRAHRISVRIGRVG